MFLTMVRRFSIWLTRAAAVLALSVSRASEDASYALCVRLQGAMGSGVAGRTEDINLSKSRLFIVFSASLTS